MAKDTQHFYNNISVKGIVANGYIGSAGQTLASNGTATYWSDSTGYAGSRGYTGSQGKVDVQSSTPPTPVYEGQIWFDSENIKTYVYYDSFWIEIGSSEVATLYNRATFSTATGSLASNATIDINLPAYKSYALLKVCIDAPCWLRLYTDTTSRTNDATRPIYTDPVAGSGVVAEIITAGDECVKMTPFVFGGNLATTPTNEIYLKATNLDTSTIDINIELTLIRLEQ